MSGVVEEAERRREEAEYRDFLRKLVDGGDLEPHGEMAVGITKLYIDKGPDALSEKQAYVFKRDVQGNFPQPECDVCTTPINWPEAYDALHGDCLCGGCFHDKERIRRE